MTKFSQTSLQDFTTAEAIAGRKARGAKFIVSVEVDDGSWCELDAISITHAKTLARNWVNKLGARGASCRVVNSNGEWVARAFFHRFA